MIEIYQKTSISKITRDEVEKISRILGEHRTLKSRSRYQKCCPTRDRNSPSLYIAAKVRKLPAYASGACNRDRVLGALEGQGLLPIAKVIPSSTQSIMKRILVWIGIHQILPARTVTQIINFLGIRSA